MHQGSRFWYEIATSFKKKDRSKGTICYYSLNPTTITITTFIPRQTLQQRSVYFSSTLPSCSQLDPQCLVSLHKPLQRHCTFEVDPHKYVVGAPLHLLVTATTSQPS